MYPCVRVCGDAYKDIVVFLIGNIFVYTYYYVDLQIIIQYLSILINAQDATART